MLLRKVAIKANAGHGAESVFQAASGVTQRKEDLKTTTTFHVPAIQVVMSAGVVQALVLFFE